MTNDQARMVLEIAPESGKTTTDSEPCTLRSLLHEMEEEGIVDVGVKGHSCERPGASAEGQPSLPPCFGLELKSSSNTSI